MWVRVRHREYGGKKKIRSSAKCREPVVFPSPYSELEFLVNVFASLSLRPCMLENGFIELPMTFKYHFPLKRHRNIVLFICCNHNIKIWLLLSLEICIHTNKIVSVSPCVVQAFIEVPVREWTFSLLRYFLRCRFIFCPKGLLINYVQKSIWQE